MDLIVTVPKSFGLYSWVGEGDAAGTQWSGKEWDFYLPLRTPWPPINPGDRVYVTYNGILRGYAPLVRVARYNHSYSLVRHGNAVAITIDEPVPGFRGWKERWWPREKEYPFDYEWYDGRPAWTVPMEISVRAGPERGTRIVYFDDVIAIGAITRQKEILLCYDCHKEGKSPRFKTDKATIDHVKQEHMFSRLAQWGEKTRERQARIRQATQEAKERRMALLQGS
jgi:hypothetical protein